MFDVYRIYAKPSCLAYMRAVSWPPLTGWGVTDNTVHPVEKEGTITFNNNGDPITLKSVYHVPGMKKNLFSVANVVDSGNYVLFGPNEVKFFRNVSKVEGDVVHTGKRVKDLFILSASTSYVDKMSTNDNASLWHARLGHLNMYKLKVMVNKKLVDGLPHITTFSNGELCEGCQYGKAHRLPFDRSRTRYKAPLELIHSDVMGPTRTHTFSGYRYMVVFVDDFTRFTWVYFVKRKSEVIFRFMEFKEKVEGELQRKIKLLRTDNGGEYTSREFNIFCSKHSIRRQLTCADTSQQNGIAERKIQHLTETCKSWLYAKNLPKVLWAEDMACATYVINRIPLSPINMKSPYEMMYNEKPNVKDFKVFGSVCYVHIPDSQRSKLDAKARKCIFIGYDERKKGWKCMDPKTRKCKISRDVVFDEISCYYSPGGVSVGAPSTIKEHEELPMSLLVTSSAPASSSTSSSPSSPIMSKSFSSSELRKSGDRGSEVNSREVEQEENANFEGPNAPKMTRSGR